MELTVDVPPDSQRTARQCIGLSPDRSPATWHVSPRVHTPRRYRRVAMARESPGVGAGVYRMAFWYRLWGRTNRAPF
jgi:hypothetical protein